jgi:hypothetical protein
MSIDWDFQSAVVENGLFFTQPVIIITRFSEIAAVLSLLTSSANSLSQCGLYITDALRLVYVDRLI